MGLFVGEFKSCVCFDSFEVLEGVANLAAAALLEVLDRTQLAVGPLGLGSFHCWCSGNEREATVMVKPPQPNEWIRSTAIAV